MSDLINRSQNGGDCRDQLSKTNKSSVTQDLSWKVIQITLQLCVQGRDVKFPEKL